MWRLLMIGLFFYIVKLWEKMLFYKWFLVTVFKNCFNVTLIESLFSEMTQSQIKY